MNSLKWCLWLLLDLVTLSDLEGTRELPRDWFPIGRISESFLSIFSLLMPGFYLVGKETCWFFLAEYVDSQYSQSICGIQDDLSLYVISHEGCHKLYRIKFWANTLMRSKIRASAPSYLRTAAAALSRPAAVRCSFGKVGSAAASVVPCGLALPPTPPPPPPSSPPPPASTDSPCLEQNSSVTDFQRLVITTMQCIVCTTFLDVILKIR